MALYRHGKDVSGVVEVKTKGGETMTREEAINQLGWLTCKTNEEQKLEAIDMAIEALKSRPKGHWIEENPSGTFICSECGHKPYNQLTMSNYCPWCGADMRGENDE